MATLKLLHVIVVVLSVTGFFLRALAMRDRPVLLRNRWVRTVPHVNDTLLLGSGLAMVIGYRWNPLDQPWLMAKLIALLAYIVIGSLAIGRRGRHGIGARTAFALAAILVFAYIVLVALFKTPRPWLLF